MKGYPLSYFDHFPVGTLPSLHSSCVMTRDYEYNDRINLVIVIQLGKEASLKCFPCVIHLKEILVRTGNYIGQFTELTYAKCVFSELSYCVPRDGAKRQYFQK